jgi:hypothetical protein
MDGAKMAGKWRGRHAPNDVRRGVQKQKRASNLNARFT